jgi:hypothetical protein
MPFGGRPPQQEIKLIELPFLQKQILTELRKRPQNNGIQDTSRTTDHLGGKAVTGV